MALSRGYGRPCTSWVWLLPFNSLTPLPLLDSLVQRNPAQMYVIEIDCERGVQAQKLQYQFYACVRITQQIFPIRVRRNPL